MTLLVAFITFVMYFCAFWLGWLSNSMLRKAYNKWKMRQYTKKREAEEESFRKMKEEEYNEYLNGNLSWLATGPISRETAMRLLGQYIWGDDMENITWFCDFVKKELGNPSDTIIIEDFEERGSFDLTLIVKPRDDTDDHRRSLSRAIDELDEYIHDTYGEAGEMDLHLTIRMRYEWE